jgi:guanine deaminase
MNSPILGVRGFLIDAPELGRLRARSDGALVIDGGLIAEIGDYATLAKKPRAEPIRWIHSNSVAVFPGLIDLHSHVPQYPAVACGTDDLLPWLRQRIFPLERIYRSAGAAGSGGFFCGTRPAGHDDSDALQRYL